MCILISNGLFYLSDCLFIVYLSEEREKGMELDGWKVERIWEDMGRKW